MLGPDPNYSPQDNCGNVCAVLEEQKSKKLTQPVPISGPELAAMMKIGTRVVRGVDWKWGDQVHAVYLLDLFTGYIAYILMISSTQ